jgi:hypothetical protein
MKLKIDDDANVSVNVEHGIPTDDIQDVIDKVVDGAITVIVVGTIAQIIKARFN